MERTEDALLSMNIQIRDIRQDLNAVHAQIATSLEAAQYLSLHRSQLLTQQDHEIFNQVRISIKDMLASHESSFVRSLGRAGSALDSARTSLVKIKIRLDAVGIDSLHSLVQEAYDQLDQACLELVAVLKSCASLSDAVKDL